MTDRVYNLRSRRSLRAVASALRLGAHRFGVRVVRLSLQRNHIHMIVEAPDHVSLTRAMKGLGVRLAHRLNRMMGTRGQVIDDRYHARRLRSPSEVRAAIHYVQTNLQHHFPTNPPVADVWSASLAALLPAPVLWLVAMEVGKA